LEPRADTTVLGYDADVDIGGKLMSVGSRLIQSAASKNLDAFFGALKAHIERNVDAATEHAEAGERPVEASPDTVSNGAHVTGVAQPPEAGQPAPPVFTHARPVPEHGATTRWRVWLIGAGSGVVGLLIGVLIGHAA
jgi:hypothetical protein